jgi:hypothetical protein
MSREECIHELDPQGCSVCTGRDAKPPPGVLDPSKSGPWFSARYPGPCSLCDEPFDEDDEIRADGEGGYLAGACGKEEA